MPRDPFDYVVGTESIIGYELGHVYRAGIRNVTDKDDNYMYAIILQNHLDFKITPGEWGFLSYLMSFANKGVDLPNPDNLAKAIRTSSQVFKRWRISLNLKGYLSLNKYRDARNPYIISEYDLTPMLIQAMIIEEDKQKKKQAV